jgi:hypothetical protein
MSKADLPKRSLFREAWPLPAANKSSAPANKSKRGRPVKSTGDPTRDARNAQQAGLMRKRRAAGK